MARGWESKSIESQQNDHASGTVTPRKPVTEEMRERRRARASLELSRSRVVAGIEACRSEAHRASLESALAFLDAELRKLADSE